MWNLVQNINPIWFFDATGSILADVPLNNSPLLYSIVCYDNDTNSIIPIAEFFTTCQEATTICQFLLVIKNKIEMYISGKKFAIAPVIVTDCSWTLINSVLNIFNQCNINQYLDWCFDFIVLRKQIEHKNTSMPTHIYLCCVHFLDIIWKETIKVLNEGARMRCKHKEKIKQTFILSFTLLQCCSIFETFNSYLVDIYNIFNQKTQNKSFLISFKRIRNCIADRKQSEKFLPKKHEKIETYCFINRETKKSIKKNSKFEAFYVDYINKLEKLVGTDQFSETSSKEPQNDFYFPKLFDIIKKKLYILPIWSGLVIFANGPVGMYTTHINNNPVEQHFNHTRNTSLKVNKHQKMARKVSPSEYVAKLNLKLTSKYIEFYKTNFDHDSKKKFNKDQKEKWSDGSRKKFKNKEGFYYKPIPNFGYLNEFNESRLNNLPNNDFDRALLIGNFNLFFFKSSQIFNLIRNIFYRFSNTERKN